MTRRHAARITSGCWKVKWRGGCPTGWASSRGHDHETRKKEEGRGKRGHRQGPRPSSIFPLPFGRYLMRILAIGRDPGDLEIGMGGTILALGADGRDLTVRDAHDSGLPPVRPAAR